MAGTAVLLVVGAAPAATHAEVIDSNPLPGSIVNDLDRVELTFLGDIIGGEDTTIRIESQANPDVEVELGPPELEVSSVQLFVEDEAQSWNRLVVRGATREARVSVFGIAEEVVLEPEDAPDGIGYDLSALPPDGVQRIRVAEPGIAVEGIEVELFGESGFPVPTTPPLPASSAMAADVLGDFPEPGRYIIRITTIAADEGFVQPYGYLFTYDPDFVPTSASSGSGTGQTIGYVLIAVAVVLALGGGVVYAARRRVAAAAGSDS